MSVAKAMADENRVRMLMLLSGGELCVCRITELFGLSPSTTSKHLSILYQAGLVNARKEGRWIYYSLPGKEAAPVVVETIHWLDRALAGNPQIAADAVRLQSILDLHTSPWGVKVTMVEVKQVDLAEQMIRVLARQAEAERERRAKIIHAEGEYTAAEKLAMAAEVIQKQPAALQLRYLQTLVEIGSEKNTTIVFPLPLDILTSLGRALERVGNGGAPGTGNS